MRLKFWQHRSDEHATRTDALRAMRGIRRTNKRNEPVPHNASDSPNDLWYAMQLPTNGS